MQRKLRERLTTQIDRGWWEKSSSLECDALRYRHNDFEKIIFMNTLHWVKTTNNHFRQQKKTPPNLKNKEMSNSSIIVWYMHKVEHRLTTLDLLMIWCGPYKVDFSGLHCRALYRRVGCAATISQLLSISEMSCSPRRKIVVATVTSLCLRRLCDYRRQSAVSDLSGQKL